MSETPLNYAKSASRRRFRWLFVWLVPLVWVAGSFLNALEPGDEYMLWGVGSFAGTWIYAFVNASGSFWANVASPLLVGAIVMALAGLLLAWLRASITVLVVIFAIVAASVALTSIAAHPSIARAIAKHGSLAAYWFFGAVYGWTIAVGLTIVGTAAWRLLFTTVSATRPAKNAGA